MHPGRYRGQLLGGHDAGPVPPAPALEQEGGLGVGLDPLVPKGAYGQPPGGDHSRPHYVGDVDVAQYVLGTAGELLPLGRGDDEPPHEQEHDAVQRVRLLEGEQAEDAAGAPEQGAGARRQPGGQPTVAGGPPQEPVQDPPTVQRRGGNRLKTPRSRLIAPSQRSEPAAKAQPEFWASSARPIEAPPITPLARGPTRAMTSSVDGLLPSPSILVTPPMNHNVMPSTLSLARRAATA